MYNKSIISIMVCVLNVFTIQSLVASGKKSVLPVVITQQYCQQCSDLSALQPHVTFLQSMFFEQNKIIKKMERSIAQLQQAALEQNTSMSILQKSVEKRKRENESLKQKNYLLARSLMASYDENVADVDQPDVPSKQKILTCKASKKQAIPVPLRVPNLSSSGSSSVFVPWAEQSSQVILPLFKTYQQQEAASIPVDHEFDISAKLVIPSSISWKDEIVLNF